MLVAQETRQLIFQKLCTVTKTSALRQALKPRAGQRGLKEKPILRLSDQQYPAIVISNWFSCPWQHPFFHCDIPCLIVSLGLQRVWY